MPKATAKETTELLLENDRNDNAEAIGPETTEDANAKPENTSAVETSTAEASKELTLLRDRLAKAEQTASLAVDTSETLKLLRAQNDMLAKRLDAITNETTASQTESKRNAIRNKLRDLHIKRKAAERADDDEACAQASAQISETEHELWGIGNAKETTGTYDVEKLISEIDRRHLVQEAAAFRAEQNLSEDELQKLVQVDTDMDREPMWRLVKGTSRWKEGLRRIRSTRTHSRRPELQSVEAPDDESKPTTSISMSIAEKRIAQKLGISEENYAKQRTLLGR